MLAASAACCLLGAVAAANAAGPARAAPAGLIDIAAIAPAVAVDMRYTGPDNVTTRPLPGYPAPRCWLTAPAATALAQVQERLKADGLGLLVYDCWRPLPAVAALVTWAGAPGPAFGFWHPRTPRRTLMDRGYIARRSRHSQGRAIDLTLVRLGQPRTGSWTGADCRDSRPPAASGWLDMGTTWDCFDPDSATNAPGISAGARDNRAILKAAMAAEGFRNYPREWWHFEFRGP